MRKLFTKPKPTKPQIEDAAVPTPIHHQHALYSQHAYMSPPPRSIRRTSSEGERWEVVQSTDPTHYIVSPSHNSSYASLPPGASPPIPTPNGARSPSPFSISSSTGLKDREPQPQQPRRKTPMSAPVALRILNALDPAQSTTKSASEERSIPTPGHSDGVNHERDKEPPEKKRAFWSRGDRDKDKEQQRDKPQDVRDRGRDRGRDGEAAELTRMIGKVDPQIFGYLTATAHQDRNLVSEIIERVNMNETNAKEAARALRREFKYGEPAAQLAAARLWAILLRRVKNEWFVQQSTTRKFTETLEDVLSPSARTSPVVRERILDVIAAAAFASGKSTGFRALWKRVKPHDKPEEGMPLELDDTMFHLPTSGRPQYDNIPQVVYQDQSAFPADLPAIPHHKTHASRKHKTPESRNRIIPPDEDIRRLFQECKIGQGNASLLSQALALSRPEDLKKKDVIKVRNLLCFYHVNQSIPLDALQEFYVKCRSSQELIFAQISWASAGAEKSRVAKDQEALANGYPEEQRLEQTVQEKLLASLLSANGELMDALQQYDDLERVAMERMAEEVSRRETKMDPRQIQQLQQDGDLLSDSSHGTGRARNEALNISRSRSPSPMAVPQTPYRHQNTQSHSHLELVGTGGLAPPPPAPHGPRLPSQASTHASTYSRTPSPPTPVQDDFETLPNGMAGMRLRKESVPSIVEPSMYHPEEDAGEVPVRPSEKALGKQRVVEDDSPDRYRAEDFDGRDETYSVDSRLDSDDDRSTHEGWPYHHRPQQQFVYDAAAERTQERIRKGQDMLVNGVH
ncbi:hypothetical protein C0992_003764 [Termitomyces sp. T32_za158]|nr:hypothetical protein C0992_003764 [Termitomyces sp. T32_za158]